MAVFYIVGCFFVILVNIENLPSAIVLIVKSAFNFDAGVEYLMHEDLPIRTKGSGCF